MLLLPPGLWGISRRFHLLSPCLGHVLTRYSPIRHYEYLKASFQIFTVRLACVRHAASVYPEPGSNSPFDSCLCSSHALPFVQAQATRPYWLFAYCRFRSGFRTGVLLLFASAATFLYFHLFFCHGAALVQNAKLVSVRVQCVFYRPNAILSINTICFYHDSYIIRLYS